MATDVGDQMNFLQFRWYTSKLNHLKMQVYECSGDTGRIFIVDNGSCVMLNRSFDGSFKKDSLSSRSPKSLRASDICLLIGNPCIIKSRSLS